MPVSAPSGYRKRRQRATHQPHVYHQQHPPNVQQPHPRPPQQSRDDINDEMDILSVKQEVSKRFVLNHSLLENVTSKFFAMDDIIPPKSFPEAVIQGTKYVFTQTEAESVNKELMEREELITKSKLTNLLPNDITFGDLKLMKLQLKMLEEDVNVLEKEEKSMFEFGAEFEYQSKLIELMRKAFAELNDKESHLKNQELVDNIMNKDYNGGKFKRKIKETPRVTKFSQNDLFTNKITATSVDEERKREEALLLPTMLPMQASPQQQSPSMYQAPPSQQQQPPPMVPMSSQNPPYDIYNNQQSFIPASASSTVHNNQPLPPPTFLSALLSAASHSDRSTPQSRAPSESQIHSQLPPQPQIQQQQPPRQQQQQPPQPQPQPQPQQQQQHQQQQQQQQQQTPVVGSQTSQQSQVSQPSQPQPSSEPSQFSPPSAVLPQLLDAPQSNQDIPLQLSLPLQILENQPNPELEQEEEQQQQQPHQRSPASYDNPQLDNFDIFPPDDKDIFDSNPADDILIDDATFNGLQSTLDDQIFFDHSME